MKELLPSLMERWIAIVRPLRAINTGKDSLKVIIIGLRNRIEFMRVAAGAMNRGADERRHRCHYHVVSIEIFCGELVDRVIENAHLGAFIPRSGSDKSGGDDSPRIIRGQNI